MLIAYTFSLLYHIILIPIGEIFNSKGNLADHINDVKGKAEAAYQTMLTIAGNKHFHNIQMKAIWKMVETCIIPIITYGGETRTPTKKETKELNNILDNIIKRILMVPRTTPREVLYIETGIMDIEHICMRNRVNMEKKTRHESRQSNIQSEGKWSQAWMETCNHECEKQARHDTS